MIFTDNRFRSRSIKRIGSGVSGNVDICESREGSFLFVVKTYHGKEKYESKHEYQERVLYEYEMLQKLNHPNIISVYKSKISFSGSEVKVYMEAGSMDFKSLVRQTPPERSLLHFWKQLCNAVRYLHNEMEICHRDLKIENLVLVNDATLKIIDFATAVPIKNNEQAVGLVGSESYAAPETYSSLRYDGKSADMWSVGIILYYFANRRLPWRMAKQSDPEYMAGRVLYTADSIRDSGNGTPPPSTKITAENGQDGQSFFLSQAFCGLLESDPGKRFTILDLDKYGFFVELSEFEST